MAKKSSPADEAVIAETSTNEVVTETVAADAGVSPDVSNILRQAAEKAAADAKAKADAKAAKEAEKAAKAEKRAADKLAKEQAKAAKTAEKAAKQPQQNGISRPRAGSDCGKIWDICDAVSKEMKQPAPIAAVLEVAKQTASGDQNGAPAGVTLMLNPTTVRVQYARWRKFHGVSGRVTAPVAAPVEAADAVISETAQVVDEVVDAGNGAVVVASAEPVVTEG